MDTPAKRSITSVQAHTATVEVDAAFDAAVLAAAEADSEAQQAAADDPWPGTGTLFALVAGGALVLLGVAGLAELAPVPPLVALALLGVGAAGTSVAARRLYHYVHELADIVE